MKWDVFICHASEDKEALVRPLARLLQERGLRVWYDEFSLKPGSRLRRSVDHGLANSRYGLVVLSPSFFQKEWPQRELDGLITKESDGAELILPILHEITIEDVAAVSPTLGDRIAISSSADLDNLCKKILEAIEPRSEITEELGRHHHYLIKEIGDQPLALALTIERLLEGPPSLSEMIRRRAGAFSPQWRLVVVGCGSSYNAAALAKYWIETIAGIPCQIQLPSELLEAEERRGAAHQLAIFFSQSGETPEVLEALDHSLRKGSVVCAVTNETSSSLARGATLVAPTCAGHEYSVVATKTFTAQLVVSLLLASALATFKGLGSVTQKSISEELRALPGRVQKVLDRQEEAEPFAKELARARSILIIGSGAALPIARQAANMIIKTSHIMTGALPPGEVKHGPMALIDEDLPAIVLSSPDKKRVTARAISQIQARDGRVIVVGEGANSFPESAHLFAASGETSITTPILLCVPMQILAYRMGLQKGNDIDSPRGLLEIRQRRRERGLFKRVGR